MKDILNIAAFKTVPNVVESICNWNAARYDRDFDFPLQVTLFKEEFYEELMPAVELEDVVEICDALGDIFYLAVGALWKLNCTDALEDYIDEVEGQQASLCPLPVALLWFELTASSHSLALVVLSSLAQLAKILRGSQTAALDIIRAICISNDTKEAVKTAKGIKANINKGASYISPTKHIQAIITAVEAGEYNDTTN